MRPDEPLSRIMTEAVVAIDFDRPVSEALDCFRQYPIHHLPVLRDGRLAGMLSSADVTKLEFFLPRVNGEGSRYLDDRFTIERMMHAPVVTASPATSIAEAAERMESAGVHALPVVDEHDRVLGLVTTADLIRCLLHGPPRHGVVPLPDAVRHAPAEDAREEPVCHRKPNDEQYRTALRTAQVLHVEDRDPRHLGKTLLYLDQRCARVEMVLELADRFLLIGQDEHTHALLLKAIHAAKGVEERATGHAREAFAIH
jgi:CBS domain-containing protein